MYCIVNLVSLIIALDIVIVLISFFFPSYSCACFLFHFFFQMDFVELPCQMRQYMHWIELVEIKNSSCYYILYYTFICCGLHLIEVRRDLFCQKIRGKRKKQQINNQWQKQKNSNLMHKKCHLFTFLCACDNLVDVCIFLKCPNKRAEKKSANLDEMLLFVFQFDWIAASFSFDFWWFN